jgi:hypothetical protein
MRYRLRGTCEGSDAPQIGFCAILLVEKGKPPELFSD